MVAVGEHEALGRLATVRLREPQGAQVVDLLFASSGIEPEIAAASEVMRVMPGLMLHVAHTGHLIALKLLARDDATRPQDAADLRPLRQVVDDAEVQLAREAVALIDQRGFARDRDINDASTELLTD